MVEELALRERFNPVFAKLGETIIAFALDDMV